MTKQNLYLTYALAQELVEDMLAGGTALLDNTVNTLKQGDPDKILAALDVENGTLVDITHCYNRAGYIVTFETNHPGEE